MGNMARCGRHGEDGFRKRHFAIDAFFEWPQNAV